MGHHEDERGRIRVRGEDFLGERTADAVIGPNSGMSGDPYQTPSGAPRDRLAER